MENQVIEKESKSNLRLQTGIFLAKLLIVIFLISGFVSLFKAIFKTVAFDQYPLPDHRLTTFVDGKEKARPESELADLRKLQMLDDYSGAITLLLIAGCLTWLAKKKIA